MTRRGFVSRSCREFNFICSALICLEAKKVPSDPQVGKTSSVFLHSGYFYHFFLLPFGRFLAGVRINLVRCIILKQPNKSDSLLHGSEEGTAVNCRQGHGWPAPTNACGGAKLRLGGPIHRMLCASQSSHVDPGPPLKASTGSNGNWCEAETHKVCFCSDAVWDGISLCASILPTFLSIFTAGDNMTESYLI